MKNAPKWTPEFLEKCTTVEKTLGWCKGSIVEDIKDWIQNANLDELEDGMRNDYLYIGFDSESDADLSMFRIDIYAVVIQRDDMDNWDEFISTRLTMARLGACDED